MIKKTIFLIAMSIALSGCYMVPMALIGPATSGFTTASLLQSGATTTANYLVKKSTGKSLRQHALTAINQTSIQQSYFPQEENLVPIVKP
jgi:hypothetical protein